MISIEFLKCSLPKPLKRKRRLEKKMHIGDFKEEYLEINFTHNELPIDNADEQFDNVTDKLIDISIDTGINLGLSSCGEGVSIALFEVPLKESPTNTFERLVIALRNSIEGVEILSATVDDLWWPTEF